MKYRINPGDAIPDFRASDQEGNEILAEDLFGTPVVLYFYPKDDTPKCTEESCSFRDSMESLAAHDVQVIGISPDNADSHKKFAEKHSLNFTLICDPERELCKKFDVIQEKDTPGGKSLGVERSTFLIDRDGIVVWIERPVDVDGHVQRVLEAVKKEL